MKTFFTFALLLASLLAVEAQTTPTIVVGTSTNVNSLVVSKGGTCKLFAVTGQNLSGGTEYIQVFQTNAVPGNGTIPTFSVPVPASPQFFSLDFSFYGADLYPGCTVCASTTATTLTLAGGTSTTIQAVVGANNK